MMKELTPEQYENNKVRAYGWLENAFVPRLDEKTQQDFIITQEHCDRLAWMHKEINDCYVRIGIDHYTDNELWLIAIDQYLVEHYQSQLTEISAQILVKRTDHGDSN